MALAAPSLPGGVAELGQALRAGAAELASLAVGQPVAVAAGMALAGLVLVAIGVRWPRVAGALGGAAVGALAVLGHRGALQGAWPEGPVQGLAATAAVVLLVAGALWPSSAALAGGALLGLAIGVVVPVGDDPRTGPALATLAGGLAAWFGWRKALALLASLVGAALLGGGLLAWLPPPLGAELAERPAALLAWLFTLTAVGLAFQLGAAPSSGRGRKVSPADHPEAPAARSPGSPS